MIWTWRFSSPCDTCTTSVRTLCNYLLRETAEKKLCGIGLKYLSKFECVGWEELASKTYLRNVSCPSPMENVAVRPQPRTAPQLCCCHTHGSDSLVPAALPTFPTQVRVQMFFFWAQQIVSCSQCYRACSPQKGQASPFPSSPFLWAGQGSSRRGI